MGAIRFPLHYRPTFESNEIAKGYCCEEDMQGHRNLSISQSDEVAISSRSTRKQAEHIGKDIIKCPSQKEKSKRYLSDLTISECHEIARQASLVKNQDHEKIQGENYHEPSPRVVPVDESQIQSKREQNVQSLLDKINTILGVLPVDYGDERDQQIQSLREQLEVSKKVVGKLAVDLSHSKLSQRNLLSQTKHGKVQRFDISLRRQKSEIVQPEMQKQRNQVLLSNIVSKNGKSWDRSNDNTSDQSEQIESLQQQLQAALEMIVDLQLNEELMELGNEHITEEERDLKKELMALGKKNEEPEEEGTKELTTAQHLAKRCSDLSKMIQTRDTFTGIEEGLLNKTERSSPSSYDSTGSTINPKRKPRWSSPFVADAPSVGELQSVPELSAVSETDMTMESQQTNREALLSKYEDVLKSRVDSIKKTLSA